MNEKDVNKNKLRVILSGITQGIYTAICNYKKNYKGNSRLFEISTSQVFTVVVCSIVTSKLYFACDRWYGILMNL